METEDLGQGSSSPSKECVILLHGYGSRVRDLNPLLLTLQSDFEVITPDLSQMYSFKQPATFSEQVELLGQICTESSQGRHFHLVGLSYGGALAWALASKNPSHCRSLSLINPMGPDPMSQFRPLAMKLLCRTPLSRTLMNWILESRPGRSAISHMMGVFGRRRRRIRAGRSIDLIGQMLFSFCYATKNEDWKSWRKELSKVTAPSSIYCSEFDPLFRRESFSELGHLLGIKDISSMSSRDHLPGSEQLTAASLEIIRFIQTAKFRSKAA